MKRLLLQNQVKKQLKRIDPNLTDGRALEMLRRWFIEDKGATVVSTCFHYITFPYIHRNISIIAFSNKAFCKLLNYNREILQTSDDPDNHNWPLCPSIHVTFYRESVFPS